MKHFLIKMVEGLHVISGRLLELMIKSFVQKVHSNTKQKTLKCFTCKVRPHGEDSLNSIARGLNEMVARSHLTVWECPLVVGFLHCRALD
jgi:hypothetical protein